MVEDLIGSRRGLLFILSSPSGAGKSTISRSLLADEPNLTFSVSATTRAPRPGEQDGREYFFKTRAEFGAMIEAGELLEHAEVFGNLYGTPISPVEAAIANGQDVLFDIDWQGGQQIANSTLQDAVVSVFILPPSLAELEKRLKGRAQDSDDIIAGRMAKSMGEINHWSEYDYVLVNRDLDECAAEVTGILQAERLRRRRRPGLVEFVQKLNREFEGSTS
ncbi:MAG: guanylate kinase [Paracoccaceae bacterium]|jgi:guanylate kinase|nr:guanylate kinase [Paracoccaceae bacterium]MDG1370435.1 guanylate kinase [Paracoccaceae bacterium]